MPARALRRQMRAYRIGDPDGLFPIYSKEGAKRIKGRWHERGQDVIYASEHYSTALLEILAQRYGRLPPNQHFIEIEIPAGTSYEVVTKDTVLGWDLPDSPLAREHGAQWFAQCRSAILMVPSIIAREENNILINLQHRHAASIHPGLEKPVRWDARLFGTQP